jgi:autoinducer 2-degrading protein
METHPARKPYPTDVTDEEWAMYWRVYRFEAKPERRDELLQASKAHAEESVREEPGTLAFSFIQDEQDENRFYAVEHYADREAQRAHTEGQVMQRNAPKVGPLLAGPPVLLASGDQLAL